MKKMLAMTSGAMAAALALTAAGLAAPPAAAPAAGAVTCASPVGPRDSAAALVARFRGAARIQSINGPEGEQLRGVVIYPRDESRRLEVLFHDAAMRRPATVRTSSARSSWSFGGLKIGDPMSKVAQINGRPFQLYGFEWDYGGQVTDWLGGALKSMPGGCRVSVGLNNMSDTTPESAMGDVLIRSDMPALKGLNIRVGKLSIDWPQQGQVFQ